MESHLNQPSSKQRGRKLLHFPSFFLRFLIWRFPKIVVPQNGWLIMENPSKMGWFGGTPYFWKHPYLLISCFACVWGEECACRGGSRTSTTEATLLQLPGGWCLCRGGWWQWQTSGLGRVEVGRCCNLRWSVVIYLLSTEYKWYVYIIHAYMYVDVVYVYI